MKKQIFVHAGAHRTGSSSFQMCLFENRAVLDQAGYDVAYPGRDGVPRGRLRLRLPGPRHRMGDPKFGQSVADAVRKFSPKDDRALVLSEENLPGRMFHFYQGQFFPAAAKRFDAFRAGAEVADLHVLYVLRPYDQLFVSAFRKRAEDNPVPAFDSLLTMFLDMERGWPDLIQDMQTTLKPVSLTIVPFHKRGSSRSLLARLLPDMPEGDLIEPEQTMNLSATDAALMALQDLYQKGEELERDAWQEVVRNYAGNKENKGFAAFPTEQRDILRARYDRDLERIAQMPDLTFL